MGRRVDPKKKRNREEELSMRQRKRDRENFYILQFCTGEYNIRHPIKSDIFYYSPVRIIIILCDWRDYKATK